MYEEEGPEREKQLEIRDAHESEYEIIEQVTQAAYEEYA